MLLTNFHPINCKFEVLLESCVSIMILIFNLIKIKIINVDPIYTLEEQNGILDLRKSNTSNLYIR